MKAWFTKHEQPKTPTWASHVREVGRTSGAKSHSLRAQPTSHHYWDMEWEGLKRGREQLKNTQALTTTTTLHTCSHTALDRETRLKRTGSLLSGYRHKAEV